MFEAIKDHTVFEIGGHRVVVGELHYTHKESDHPWYNCKIDDEFGYLTVYRRGIIKWSLFKSGKYVPELYKNAPTTVVIEYRDGRVFEWLEKNDLSNAYNGQFGLSVSLDGRFVFVQSWEKGLFCYNAQTGDLAWRSKRRFGITNIYVNEKTVLCHQYDKALQLLDIETGEVIKEKTPARDWGFTYLKEGYIICHTSARKWEIIRTEDLETVEEIPDKLFGKGEWCINSIRLTEENKLVWRGFQNEFDDSNDESEYPPETMGEVKITEELNHGK